MKIFAEKHWKVVCVCLLNYLLIFLKKKRRNLRNRLNYNLRDALCYKRSSPTTCLRIDLYQLYFHKITEIDLNADDKYTH